MDDLARARVRRRAACVDAELAIPADAIANLAAGDPRAVIRAYDSLQARRAGHCGRGHCIAERPRQVLGVCGCRCMFCRAAEAARP
jgi:hypothetical protein